MNIHFFDRKGQIILSVNFVIPVGKKTIYNEKRNNFAHLIEHLLFHGHPDLSEYEIMLEMEKLGAIVNAETNDYYTEVYIRIQEKYLMNAISFFSEAIQAFDIKYSDYRHECEIVNMEEALNISKLNKCVDGIILSCFKQINQDRTPSFKRVKNIFNNIYKNWSLIIIGEVSLENKETIYNYFKCSNNDINIVPQNVLTGTMIKKNIYFNKKIDDNYIFAYVRECSKTTGIMVMKIIRYIYTNGISSILYNYLIAEKNYCYSINFREYMVGNNFFIIYFTYNNAPKKDLEEYFDYVFSEEFIRNLSETQIKRAINMIITDALLKKESISSIMNDIVENLIFDQKLVIDNEVIDQLKELKSEEARMAIIRALF